MSQFSYQDTFVGDYILHGAEDEADGNYQIGLDKVKDTEKFHCAVFADGFSRNEFFSPHELKSFFQNLERPFLIFNLMAGVAEENSLVLVDQYGKQSIFNVEYSRARSIKFNLLREMLMDLEHQRKASYFRLDQFECLQEGAERVISENQEAAHALGEDEIIKRYLGDSGEQGFCFLKKLFKAVLPKNSVVFSDVHRGYQLVLNHPIVFVREEGWLLRTCGRPLVASNRCTKAPSAAVSS